MHVVYSEDEAEYQRQVRNFVERELRPLVETEYDFSGPLTRDDVSGIRSRIASHEIAVTAPRREDGQLDLICFSIFIEEVSKLHFGFGSLAMAIFFEVWDMIDLLNDAQRARYERLFAPGALMSIAISEPNVGSNPSQIEATATRTADGWVLNGTKLWTSHAQISDGIMVACRKLDDGDDQGVSLFIVDRAEQEYDVRAIPCLGMDATSVCEVTFDECWLPPEAEATRRTRGTPVRCCIWSSRPGSGWSPWPWVPHKRRWTWQWNTPRVGSSSVGPSLHSKWCKGCSPRWRPR